MFYKSVAFMTIACFRSVLKPVYPHLNKCCSIYHVRVFQICYQSLHFQKLQVILNLDLDFGLCFSKVYAPLTGCYLHILVCSSLRDRPFNLKGGLWFFVPFRIFFSDNTRVRILILFQNLTLCYMTKTLNQIFFFLHQNQNIFLEKNHTPPPPLQAKWSFPYQFNYKNNTEVYLTVFSTSFYHLSMELRNFGI